MTTPHHRLARAISSHAQRQAKQLQGTFYAKILKLNPIQAEMTSQRLVLDDDDLVLSQWVRRYDYDFGLEIGDTLLVSRMPNDDFLAHDVITHNPQLEGADPTDPDPVSYTSRNGHIIAQIAVTDVDGNILGYQPVYASLGSDGAPT